MVLRSSWESTAKHADGTGFKTLDLITILYALNMLQTAMQTMSKAQTIQWLYRSILFRTTSWTSLTFSHDSCVPEAVAFPFRMIPLAHLSIIKRGKCLGRATPFLRLTPDLTSALSAAAEEEALPSAAQVAALEGRCAAALEEGPAAPALVDRPAAALEDGPAAPALVDRPTAAPAFEDGPAAPALAEEPAAPALVDRPATALEDGPAAPALAEEPAAPALVDRPAAALEDVPAAPRLVDRPAAALEEDPAAPVLEEERSDLGCIAFGIGADVDESGLHAAKHASKMSALG